MHSTAIPAVLAYNFGLRRLKLHVAELDDFATDFLHLAMRTGGAVDLGSAEFTCQQHEQGNADLAQTPHEAVST